MCASPVTRCVSCVPVQAHNGRLTASCVGMLHASQRGVWRAATLLLVRRQMFCSSNFLTEENSCVIYTLCSDGRGRVEKIWDRSQWS